MTKNYGLKHQQKSQSHTHGVKAKAVTLKSGRLYFTQAFERKLFFFMTLSMLVMGILVKLGLF